MGNGKACTLAQFLHGLDGQVGSCRPVSAQNHGHNDHQRHIVGQKARQCKHDQPVSSGCLLHLYMTCGKQGPAFGQFVKMHQQDIYDECDQKKRHSLRKAFSKNLFHTCGHCVLSVTRVNHARCQIKTVLQSCQNRTERRRQSRGTRVQDQHTNDRLQRSSQRIIPFLPHQAVTQQRQETNHIGRLLQDIGRKEGPDCI